MQKLFPQYSLLVGVSYTDGTLSNKNFATGKTDERDVSGLTISGQLTYRVTASASVGIHLSYGNLDGGAIGPIGVQGVVQLTGLRLELCCGAEHRGDYENRDESPEPHPCLPLYGDKDRFPLIHCQYINKGT